MQCFREFECPSWFWVLLGISLGGVLPSESRTALAPSELTRQVPYPDHGREAHEVGLLPVTKLRQVPGIGQLRALAIARVRWRAEREGSRFELLDVPGIGPSIAAQLAAWKCGLSPEEAVMEPGSF